jgi:exodeoxyribonuclease VII large subunit
VLDILASIRTMSKQDIEVLVIIRGGGSVESFQAFNTESVVRAVASFKVPVITGIGHDVDVTLMQLVADVGVSTPTAVTALFNTQWEGLRSEIEAAEAGTLGCLQNALHDKSRFIDDSSTTVLRAYEKQVASARKIMSDASLRATSLFRNLSERVRATDAGFQSAIGIMKATLRSKTVYIAKAPSKLTVALRFSIVDAQGGITFAGRSIIRGQNQSLRTADAQLKGYMRMISTHDPERNLRLGYSLSYVDGKIVRDVGYINVGDTLMTRLSNGSLISEVNEVE